MAEKEVDKEIGKKCAHTGTALKRVKRYYRNGKYYVNKTAYKAMLKEKSEEAKEKEEAPAKS